MKDQILETMITKHDVLKAFDIIEKYKEQQKQIIQDLDLEVQVETDRRSILVLGLKTRELNCLRSAGIETIGELLATDRYFIRKIRFLGKRGISDINKKIKDLGIETPNFLT
jgi:DNA-directed RNA polymerase subunit alpha